MYVLCIRMYVCVGTQTYIHIHNMYMHMYTYTHTYIHTCMAAKAPWLWLISLYVAPIVHCSSWCCITIVLLYRNSSASEAAAFDLEQQEVAAEAKQERWTHEEVGLDAKSSRRKSWFRWREGGWQLPNNCSPGRWK